MKIRVFFKLELRFKTCDDEMFERKRQLQIKGGGLTYGQAETSPKRPTIIRETMKYA